MIMPRLRLPKFRFTLRTLLIACILPVPFLAWIANAKYRAVRQREAIAYFQSRGCEIDFDSDEHLTTGTFRRLLDKIDPDIARRITRIRGGMRLCSADIKQLEQLRGVRDLYFWQHSSETYKLAGSDARRLVAIKTLASIDLDAQIDSESLLGLSQLAELHSVILPQVKVDARLLKVLAQKPQIAALEFNGSKVDGLALSHLSKLPLLQTLVIHDPAPNSLHSLSGCSALTGLALYNCKLSASDGKAIQTLRIRTLDLIHPLIEKGFFQNLELHRSMTRLSIQNQAEFHSTSRPADDLQLIRLAEWRYCEDHFTELNANSQRKAQTSP